MTNQELVPRVCSCVGAASVVKRNERSKRALNRENIVRKRSKNKIRKSVGKNVLGTI